LQLDRRHLYASALKEIQQRAVEVNRALLARFGLIEKAD